VLADLANRATDLVAHYTDAGVTPRAAIAQPPDPQAFPEAVWVSSPWSFSLNSLSGGAPFQEVRAEEPQIAVDLGGGDGRHPALAEQQRRNAKCEQE